MEFMNFWMVLCYIYKKNVSKISTDYYQENIIDESNYIDKCNSLMSDIKKLDEKLKCFFTFLINFKKELNFIHNGMHLNNIMYVNGELKLIDFSKICILHNGKNNIMDQISLERKTVICQH